MEMHQLRYVVAVARTGNFSRAAEQCHVAQPSLSQQIQKLEMKEGHCLGDQVLRFCDRREVRPHISLRSAQLETVQSLVRAGLGLSLIPAMAAQKARADLPEYRSLSAPPA